MTTRPTIPEQSKAPPFRVQIARLNHIALLIAANSGALSANGFAEDADAAQLELGRQRSMLEYLIREGIEDGEALRAVVGAALAKPVNEECA